MTNSDTKKILELSPWEESIANHIDPQAEIVRFDFLSPLPKDFIGKFDGVLANNILQRFSWAVAKSVVLSWTECLKDGGELHIIVPSLEWACREVLSESPSPAALIVLYGAQGLDASVHASGYTVRGLRATLSDLGLNVTKARTAEATLEIGGKPYIINQHYLCAVKGAPELKKE